MNINFHYFAVKTIAQFAGLTEPVAQTVAAYSQLVDDYDIYASINLKDVPEYARHLAEKNGSGWKFYPVTTGFNSFIDMSRLMKEINQRLITIPFHFIPRQALSTYNANTERQYYRTVPTLLHDGTLMASMLEQARLKPSGTERIILIGMLIHTFADTYAHQQFSGFWGWENHSEVTKVENVFTGKNITSEYKNPIYHSAPSIGHTNVYHAPDDSFASFEIRLKLNEKDEYNVYYNRSNVREFVNASTAIYHYLVECFNLKHVSQEEWNAFIQRLCQGFSCNSTNIGELCKQWKKVFPNYTYNYDKKPFMAAMLEPVNIRREVPKTKLRALSGSELVTDVMYNPNSIYRETIFAARDDSFFIYNVMAKWIRDQVNGKPMPIKAILEAMTEKLEVEK